MNPSLSQALSERGYDTLTPVQEAVTDPELAMADLLVSAQTGSGKTVGFGLALAPTLLGTETHFARAEAPLALVVAPTRELAFQVMSELRWLYAKTGALVASCVGGMDMRDERRTLARGAHIVVGTPGRLRDHIMRGSLDMSGLRAIVLDEADEMLDLGFREDLEFMLDEAPAERRTLMFSATVPPMIAKLAQKFQRDAQRINTRGETKQHSDIAYQAIRVAQQDQENAIFNLLRFHDAAGAIVFANTRAAVNHLTARLSNRGFSVVCLSGELTQSERTNALQAMRDGRARVCVATDVAARGIDLPNLSLVIHADLPTNTESLLHRSGRTGRAGRKGISAMIVPQKAAKKAERLLKWAKISAEWTTAPSAEDINKLDEDRLLADPGWNEEPSEEEARFAERLISTHAPSVIAAAYLRLYRAQRSAPEDLLPPDTKPERRDRKEFGPSTWFAISVGRDDRAEARWLLPLLCRAGGLDKSAIGAIRIQDKETFVEVLTARAGDLVGNLGPGGVLEKGISARQLDAAPVLSNAPHSPRKPRPRSDAPRKQHRSPDGKNKPRRDFTSEDTPEPRHVPKPAARQIDGQAAAKADPKPKAPAKHRQKQEAVPTSSPKTDKSRRDASAKDPKRPERQAAKYAAKRPGQPTGKPGAKPTGKPSQKPGKNPGHKPGRTAGGKADRNPASATGPGRKSRMDKPSDPSNSGRRKPAQARPKNRGGDQPPKRTKR